jgi:hypothetical protein
MDDLHGLSCSHGVGAPTVVADTFTGVRDLFFEAEEVGSVALPVVFGLALDLIDQRLVIGQDDIELVRIAASMKVANEVTASNTEIGSRSDRPL